MEQLRGSDALLRCVDDVSVYGGTAFGCSAQTGPVVLRCAIRALHGFLLSAHRHALAHSQPPADLAPTPAFVVSHATAITNSFHLCHLIETLFLMPAPSACASSSSSACVAEFGEVYRLSLCVGVVELVQLVCAYVWRVACVVMETREGARRRLITDVVKTERKRQREEERKAEEAMVDADDRQ